jgi:hypothetical protein
MSTQIAERLRQEDFSLKRIELDDNYTNTDLNEIVDLLFVHPNIVTHLYLSCDKLTDATGLKLASFVGISTTIQELILYGGELTPSFYEAIASALHVNKSLIYLDLSHNQVDQNNRNWIEMKFAEALKINPRPSSTWFLFECIPMHYDEYDELKKVAAGLGHPNMQSLLKCLV